ncbi:hypothetical protein AsAng_0009790 [Aureispira anguillae]|uniref:Uncharacterized protein n=1 Tax=Aureispira anguillae TaxID=2864201 RepID=A0A916DRK7_9BACT|nr:hypothetical protein AsAng_0009790 [Aureispira anguillae]
MQFHHSKQNNVFLFFLVRFAHENSCKKAKNYLTNVTNRPQGAHKR